jgi:hypothetical protein
MESQKYIYLPFLYWTINHSKKCKPCLQGCEACYLNIVCDWLVGSIQTRDILINTLMSGFWAVDFFKERYA